MNEWKSNLKRDKVNLQRVRRSYHLKGQTKKIKVVNLGIMDEMGVKPKDR